MGKRYPTPKLFVPQNPDKYSGDVNNIVARSNLEKRFMKYLDSHPSVLQWCSEELVIKYFLPTDRKIHRYFPDFLVKVRTKDGSVKRIVVEIKPASETVRPKATRGKKKLTLLNEALTWEKNQAKWRAAEEFCKKHDMVFQVVTEVDLKHKFK